jgi:hypothetical protein
MIVELTQDERKECEQFADARYQEDQSVYQRRGSFKREDILTGAMAEVAAYKLLVDAGLKVNKPDFRVLGKSSKTYNADLSDGNYFFHVKGQSKASASKYGNSWLMQKRDPVLNNPPIKHYMITTCVDFSENSVEIFCIVPIRTLLRYQCIGECKVSWFNKTKVAIYLDDLLSIPKQQRMRFL